MNLFLFVAIAVLVGVAFMVGALFKNAITLSAIIAWIVGGLLIVLGCTLIPETQWRGLGIGAIVGGIIVVLSGIGCYKWGKNQKYHKDLDAILVSLANNKANNYKDAAQDDFKAFLDKFEELKSSNSLTKEQLDYYSQQKVKFEEELKGFHH